MTYSVGDRVRHAEDWHTMGTVVGIMPPDGYRVLWGTDPSANPKEISGEDLLPVPKVGDRVRIRKGLCFTKSDRAARGRITNVLDNGNVVITWEDGWDDSDTSYHVTEISIVTGDE